MTKHGHWKDGQPTPEWMAWHSLRKRCQDPDHKCYPNYGGRGITVCDRWEDFQLFLADMGSRPGSGYSIDRINNDLGYAPENCHWATSTEQNNNTRGNRRISAGGTTRTLAEWCRHLGIKREAFARARKNHESDDATMADLVKVLAP